MLNHEQVTRVEGTTNNVNKTHVERAYMYANPVERERLLIERATIAQAQREARFNIRNLFSR